MLESFELLDSDGKITLLNLHEHEVSLFLAVAMFLLVQQPSKIGHVNHHFQDVS